MKRMLSYASLFVWCITFLVMAKDTQNVAILSYGSLVHWRCHSVTHACLEASAFVKTPLYFPISYSVLRNKDRITAVIDRKIGVPKQVWAATSVYTNVSEAMQNLAAREGAQFLGPAGYDLQYTFYLKKLVRGQKNLGNEETIPRYPEWVMRHGTRLQLPDAIIVEIIGWANANKYDAVLWASCPCVYSDKKELITKLISNQTLLKNAQKYIKDLPNGPQTSFESAVIKGKMALQNYLNTLKD